MIRITNSNHKFEFSEKKVNRVTNTNPNLLVSNPWGYKPSPVLQKVLHSDANFFFNWLIFDLNWAFKSICWSFCRFFDNHLDLFSELPHRKSKKKSSLALKYKNSMLKLGEVLKNLLKSLFSLQSTKWCLLRQWQHGKSLSDTSKDQTTDAYQKKNFLYRNNFKMMPFLKEFT